MQAIYFSYDPKVAEERPRPGPLVVDSADFGGRAGEWLARAEAEDRTLRIRGEDGQVSMSIMRLGERPRLAAGVVLPEQQVIVVTLTNHRVIAIPFSDFAPGARGPGGTATSALAKPDYTKPRILDWGGTLGLGDGFEASLDAIIADADARAGK